MGVAWEMFIGFVEIFAVVVGICGFLLSLALILFPQRLQSISQVFNRSVNVDKTITSLDMELGTERLIYQHNVISGVCIIVGSAFVLVFLLYRFDAAKFVVAFFGANQYLSTYEIVITALSVLGKVAGVIGLLIGSILLFTPNQLRHFEKRINHNYATQSFIEKLDNTQADIDSFVFQKPRLFGFIGLVLSTILLILAIDNLLS